MRVTITQAEIEHAIELFITDVVDVPDDVRIDIDLKATRGEEGYQAIIDLVPTGAKAPDRTADDRIEVRPEAADQGLGIVDKINAAKAAPEEPTKRRGRPAGSKNKPKDTNTVSSTNVISGTNDSGETASVTTINEAVVDNEPDAEVVAPDAVVEDVPVQEPVVEPEAVEEITEDVSLPEQAPIEPEAPVEADEQEVEPELTEEEQLAAEAQATEPVQETEYEQAEPTEEEILANEARATEPAEVPEAEPVVEQAPVPKPTRSLFGNLSRPVNTK